MQTLRHDAVASEGSTRVTSARGRDATALVLVCLTVVVVFAAAMRGDYVDDDLDLLRASPAFSGIDGLLAAVSQPFWGYEVSYWRPLTSALMCVGHWLGGGQPWCLHALGLAVHLAATTLAFLVLRRLGAATVPAALAAAVFALHPCQVESVAWVAALGDPCAGAATLLAVFGWLGWRRDGDRGSPWLVWTGLGLALASKESGLAALGWLLAVDLVTRSSLRSCTSRRGWLGCAVVVGLWLGARMLVFGETSMGFGRGQLDTGAGSGHGFLLRAYLGLAYLALPTGWLGCTPYRWVSADPAALVRATLPLLSLAGLAAAACVSAARGTARGRTIAGLGALGMLAVVLPPALVPSNLGPWPVVDRYVYLAVFGAAAIWVGAGRCRTALALGLAVTCAATSAWSVPRWSSQPRVVERALTDCPQHPEPHYLAGTLALAGADRTAGNWRGRRSLCETARAAFARALTLVQRPHYGARHDRALLGLNARLGLALAELQGHLAPIADVLDDLGALAATHRDSAQVQVVLGAVHAEAGDYALAAAAWRRALGLDPSCREAAHNLARLGVGAGARGEARLGGSGPARSPRQRHDDAVRR